MKDEILIDGLTTEELFSLVESSEYEEIIFTNQPVIFRAGSSQILGQFGISDSGLRIVLSHIEGGGEGVLLIIMNLFRKFAEQKGLKEICWVVHAVDCPKPNPKLARILVMKGFEIAVDPVDGEVYMRFDKF